MANSHLSEAQQNLLVALESANEEGTKGEGADAKGRSGKGNPLRHQLHRMPTPAQQARTPSTAYCTTATWLNIREESCRLREKRQTDRVLQVYASVCGALWEHDPR